MLAALVHHTLIQLSDSQKHSFFTLILWVLVYIAAPPKKKQNHKDFLSKGESAAVLICVLCGDKLLRTAALRSR